MLDRTIAPPFNKIQKIEIRQPESVVLPNELHMYSLQAGTQPVAKLELLFDAGKWFERKNGAAYFSSSMLAEGTKKRSAIQFAEFFESQGAQYQVTPGLDHMTITVYSLSKNLPKLLPLIADMITEPSFPQKELDILKNVRTQSLKVNKQKTSYLAQRDFMRVLFGKTHPYGRITDEEHVEDVLRDDVDGFYRDAIQQRPFKIFLSGRFGEGVQQKVADAFGRMPLRNPIQVSGRNPTKSLEDITAIKEDAVQSSVRIGGAAIPMSHADYQTLLVANEIMGGYFGSRLMKNIREDKGYTYGIYSYLGQLRFGSYFAIASDVKKEFRKEAIEEIVAELDKLGDELINEKELETVKNYMLGEFVTGASTPFSLMAKFKTRLIHDLPEDYYSTLFDTIERVTARDIHEMAAKYFKPDSMVKVVVG